MDGNAPERPAPTIGNVQQARVQQTIIQQVYALRAARSAAARMLDQRSFQTGPIGSRRLRDVLAVSALASPIGVLTLARGPQGLLRLALAGETPQSVADDLRTRLGVRVAENDAALADVRDQLAGYFAGELEQFDVRLDWSLATAFHRACCEAMMRIPYGTTVTYGELAAAAGSPRAVRAAGQACATNPIAIIGPCHRVLAADGFGGYGGGLDQKRTLLALEGALLLA
jgi:methylated-DNA-[protein]-cysteine S-methyltransferase